MRRSMEKIEKSEPEPEPEPEPTPQLQLQPLGRWAGADYYDL